MIVKLPFPAAGLFPNRKNGQHWSATSKARADQRETAFYLTKQAGPITLAGGPVALSLLYVMPDNRARDLDNCLAASKAAIDGIAKALGIDDKRFKPILIDSVVGAGNGALIAAVGVSIVSSAVIE